MTKAKPAKTEPKSPRNRNKGVRTVRVADIEDNPLNFRKHPNEQKAALAGVVSEIGWYGYPDVYVTETGSIRLIDGQLRKEHLIAQYGEDATVEVNVTDFNESEASKALATHDPLSAMAESDAATLDLLLREVQSGDESVSAMLAKLAEDAGLYQQPEATIVEDEVPEVPTEAATKPGELWILGNHRLLCGDATKADDVSILMGGALADMVFTDPPYNVAYVGKTKDSLTIQNDQMKDGQFRAFLKDAFASMANVASAGAAIYVCHADSEGLNFRSAMIESGWMIKQCLIWVKNCMVMGRQDYQWRHEPILYGWKPGAAHLWNGGRKQTTVIDDAGGVVIGSNADGGSTVAFFANGKTFAIKVPSFEVIHSAGDEMDTVWRVNKPSRSADHPTMKPVAIPSRAIMNSSNPGDIVLDLFGGSGSTLSACEQTGRRCFTSELDPKYCDVIRTRWENLTGRKAELSK